MQKAIYLFLLLFIAKVSFAQESLQTIKANSTSVDIRFDDDYFAKGGWTLDPSKKPDIFSIGSKWLYETKKVTFLPILIQYHSTYNQTVVSPPPTPCWIITYE